MSDSERIRRYFESARWRPSPARTYLVDERFRVMRSIVSSLDKPIGSLAICDVGCSTGEDLARWRSIGARESRLSGTELTPDRADRAQAHLPEADVRLVADFDLPFVSATFDVTTASLVLSTIRSPLNRKRLLLDMARVTAGGGLVVVYDFAVRKPWNRQVSAVTTRSLRNMWRTPDDVLFLAPLLPALDLALRLPPFVRTGVTSILPRTHRMWVWRVPELAASGSRP